MHRKPEPKVAAQLLSQAFAAQGVTLKHQAALNLLATLEGFESYAHMKAAQPSKVSEAPTASEKHVVHLLFSEEFVRGLQDARDEDDDDMVREMLAEATSYEFDTEKELESFLEGVDAGCGWLEYDNVTDEVTANRGALSPHQ